MRRPGRNREGTKEIRTVEIAIVESEVPSDSGGGEGGGGGGDGDGSGSRCGGWRRAAGVRDGGGRQV